MDKMRRIIRDWLVIEQMSGRKPPIGWARKTMLKDIATWAFLAGVDGHHTQAYTAQMWTNLSVSAKTLQIAIHNNMLQDPPKGAPWQNPIDPRWKYVNWCYTDTLLKGGCPTDPVWRFER